MKIGQFYTWKNIDEKIWEGKLMEQRDNWLQFAILDEEYQNFDGFMILNFDILKNFSEINFHKSLENIFPGKSLKKKSFQEIMRDRLLVEIVGKMRENDFLEDDGDLFFEQGEYRFYPVERNGIYLNDGYLPMQENNIVSIYYDNKYLKNIEKLSIEKGFF
ncbi:MAG: hypothetical protein ACTTH6_04705 [Candidatus Altimarinota bacterium]